MVLKVYVIECIGKRLKGVVAYRGLQLTFPYRDAVPSHAHQPLLFLLVTLLVTGNLPHPEICVGLRHGIVPASLVTVPETAIHEDARTVLAEHNVRMPRQSCIIHTIAEALCPQEPPHHHLRLRILALDGSHIIMPL